MARTQMSKHKQPHTLMTATDYEAKLNWKQKMDATRKEEAKQAVRNRENGYYAKY